MRILKFIFVFGVLVGTANSSQSIKELMTPPADSADRENLRIWVSVERASSCRMTIKILNGNGDVIRHLVDALVPHGYHNLYWDKKDDLGEYVPISEYRFEIEDCVGKKSGTLKVGYNSKEIFAKLNLWLTQETTIWSDQDSLILRIELYKFSDSLMIFDIDTILYPGIHTLNFTNRAGAETGRFRETVLIDGKKIKESLVKR